MILAVGNTKGGVGKTTLAVNLAVARALAGRDLLLVDGDEHGTALTFTQRRAERLGEAGYTAVALTVADTLLVPVQPRSFDVWALDQVAALVAEAREINEGLRAVAILNGADPQGGDNEAALQMIGDIEGIEVLSTSIVRRKAFPNAAAEGRAVVEQTPRDAKAIDELTALISAVFV